MNEMSPKVQNQIAQFQQLQQQLQAVLNQKFQMENRLREMENTIEELEKTPKENAVYKNAGSLLIEVKDRDSVVVELEEEKETLDVRLKSLSRQEKHMREKYEGLQEQLSQALGGMGGGQSPA